MRRFLASAWYPFVVSLVLAGSMTAVFWVLEPSGDAIGNSQIAKIFAYVGWAAGSVLGLIIFVEIGILNLLRRIVRLRKVQLLHPVIVVLGILPWLVFGWILTYREPRFTPIARAIIDFVGEPMYAGSVIAVVFALLLAIPLLLPSKKSSP